MRFLTSSALAALCLSGCVEPADARPRSAEMSSDDLEPATTQMTSGRSGVDRDPDVSRDGRTLYYASTAHGELFDLYAKSVGANTTTRLTNGPGDKRFPRVSPADPRRIAFCSNERGSWELCLVPDCVYAPWKVVILIDPGSDNLHPIWSPDGKKIVYCSHHNRAAGE